MRSRGISTGAIIGIVVAVIVIVAVAVAVLYMYKPSPKPATAPGFVIPISEFTPPKCL